MVAVDFTAIGDLYKTVNLVQRRDRQTHGRHHDHQQGGANHPADGDPASISDLEALRRLPSISGTDAAALLGIAGDHLLEPAGLKDLVHGNPDSLTTTTTAPPAPPEEPTTVP